MCYNNDNIKKQSFPKWAYILNTEQEESDRMIHINLLILAVILVSSG